MDEELEHQCGLQVLSHKSLIKSCPTEARRDPRLQSKLRPEPNALLSRPGHRGGGGGTSFSHKWPEGGVSKLLQS